MSQKPGQKKQPSMPNRNQSMTIAIVIGILVIVLVNSVILPRFFGNSAQDISYSEFLTQVEKQTVKELHYNQQDQTIIYKGKDSAGNEQLYKTGVWPGDSGLIERLEKAGATFTSDIPRQSSPWTMILLSLLPLIFLLLLFGWFYRGLFGKMTGTDNDENGSGGGSGFPFGGIGGGMGNFGKSGARIVAQKETGVTFNDVAGQEEAKEQLSEIVDILHNPKRYETIGAKLPKGALLVGPPGTGKTLLAKAVAGEAGVPFFSISGSEFVEMFVGRGAAKVRDLFAQASKKAPCIVFIDEIDTVGKSRENSGLSSNDEREQTLNQLLAEMDGFDNHKGIVVLGATNRPETLDKALLRPGRFDRRIPVELPDLQGREEILKLHAGDVKMTGDIDLTHIARATSGASGADLANIINESALRAVRHKRTKVTQEDLQEAVETVIAGMQKKNSVMDAEEKRIVAYHEIGHALVAAKQNDTAPVTKITIVPRTNGALGYTMQVDEGEKYLLSKADLKKKLAVYCAGRAAEDIVFGSITTGAANDIQQITKIARAMITQYGMVDEIGMVALGTVRNRYLSGDASLECSEGMAQRIDELTIEIVNEAYQTAVQILKENKFKLHELAAYLLRKETITGEEFMNILNRDEDKFGA